jgi:hypothetical protein
VFFGCTALRLKQLAACVFFMDKTGDCFGAMRNPFDAVLMTVGSVEGHGLVQIAKIDTGQLPAGSRTKAGVEPLVARMS